MKKTVIIILAVLPIVLVITIAFAGRIFSLYRHVAVEKVKFIDEHGEELSSDYLFKVNVGETKSTNIQIFPELATNKTVSYTSQDESVCTVDSKGNVTGISIGSSTILVKTLDGGKTALLGIKVTAEKVTGVSFETAELELIPGASHTLTAVVEPYTAINKNVTYISSNPAVATVNANGKITAHSVGSATVTVTTADGGFTATCAVTVKEGEPLIRFDFTGAEGITQSGVGYVITSDEFDFTPYIKILADDITVSDVKFRIINGAEIASFDGNVISFSANGIVVILAYSGADDAPEHPIELRLLHTSK